MRASPGLLCQTPAELDLTHRKSLHAAGQDRPDGAQGRREWRDRQPGLAPRRLVFIDETWIKTNMTRADGRAPRGQRLVAAVPHGHWKTSPVVAARRCDGVSAAGVFDAAIKGAAVLAFVEQALVPTLRPRDAMIMDDLGSHRLAGVRAAIAATGASQWCLPAYSPDLSPIEMAFAKLTSLLRARAIRTVEALWNALKPLIDGFAPDEGASYLRHVGEFPSA